MNLLKIKHSVLGLLMVALIFGGTFIGGASVVYANSALDSQTNAFAGKAQFAEPIDPRVSIALMIRISLGLVGTVFLLYLIYGGYLIMTVSGNPDRIEKGKADIRNAIIGLIIILSAYGITVFVTDLAQGRHDQADCTYYRSQGGWFISNEVSIDENRDRFDTNDPFNEPGFTPGQFDVGELIPCDPPR
jgi:hypothetical protein